jgi:hypothetical protein
MLNLTALHFLSGALTLPKAHDTSLSVCKCPADTHEFLISSFKDTSCSHIILNLKLRGGVGVESFSTSIRMGQWSDRTDTI